MIAKRGLVAACAAVSLTLLAACSSSDGSTKNDRGPTDLVESLPAATKPVDLVKWALPFGEPLSLDPVRAFGESEETVVSNLCESLLRMGPDYSVNQGLATSADWTDATTFVIDLRKGVSFWDGRPMTADDVAYSLSRNLDPKLSAYGYVYTYVDKIKKTGPFQVTITFKSHDAQFRYAMASFGGTIMQRAFSVAAGDKLGTLSGGLMCTGPYKLDKWSPGEAITVLKNGTYWGGSPLVSKLDFRFITDSATLTSALLAGEIDGTFNAPVGSVEAFRNSKTGSLYTGPSSMFMGFFPVTAKGPAADPRIREALDLSIDKKAFVRDVLRGYGEPLKTMTPPIVFEGIPGSEHLRKAYNALPDKTQDLKKAKELVEQVKPTQKSLTFVFKAGDAMTLQAANIVQAAATKLGFDTKLKPLQPTDFDAFFFDEALRAGVDFVLTPGWIEVPGTLYYAPTYVLPGGFFNYSGYQNAEVTRLLEESRAAVEPEKSARLFAEAQAIFASDRPMVMLAGQYVRTFLRNDLTGVTTSSAFLSSPWAARLGGK
ncbi:ABC transporter substrate-binding protein [Nonomuraea sp. NPDC049269]|uniref:ABC transporter substrate-binding protein n=1 Tax=Nonomuraea sp. NPDC049269 TaxID=3364349 RepID=UPI00371736AD